MIKVMRSFLRTFTLKSVNVACSLILAFSILTASQARAQTVESLDKTFKAWMAKNGVQLGELAVSHLHRLVLTRGYGKTRANAPVLLASLSKAITGACVATLVDAGRIRFDSKVGDLLADYFRQYPKPADRRVKDVTIAQLLTHRSGFDRTNGDPATGDALSEFLDSNEASQSAMPELLSLALRNRLENTPGETYAYTNVSFLMLGVIIEEVTGEPYEDFCDEAVLNPLGITGARLDPEWRVLSSYGGWKLNGPQYLRFLDAFAPGSKVLGRKALAFMNDGRGKWIDDAEEVYYAMGMLVRPVSGGGHNLWHAGEWTYNLRNSVNGRLSKNTGTYAVSLESGVSWFAQYEPMPGDDAVEELDTLMYRAISKVKMWPND